MSGFVHTPRPDIADPDLEWVQDPDMVSVQDPDIACPVFKLCKTRTWYIRLSPRYDVSPRFA